MCFVTSQGKRDWSYFKNINIREMEETLRLKFFISVAPIQKSEMQPKCRQVSGRQVSGGCCRGRRGLCKKLWMWCMGLQCLGELPQVAPRCFWARTGGCSFSCLLQ